MIKYVMILLLLIVWIPTHSQKYQVFETLIERTIDSLGNVWYYANSYKCYESSVDLTFRKDYISVKTDSTFFKISVLKYYRNQDEDHNDFHIQEKLIAVKGDQVFFVEEFYHKSVYYFIYIPIKLAAKNKMLGGYGRLMIVTDKKQNCDTLMHKYRRLW